MERTILHMQINPALRKALIEKAQKENRSLSNLVETTLYALVGLTPDNGVKKKTEKKGKSASSSA